MARTAIVLIGKLLDVAPYTDQSPGFLARTFRMKTHPYLGEDSEGKQIKIYNPRPINRFYDFILQKVRLRIGSPNESSKRVFDGYISLDIADLSIFESEKSIFITLVFSGCAGMAETSNVVLAHWLQKVLIDYRTECEDFLINENHFELRDFEQCFVNEIIIATKSYGYGILNKNFVLDEADGFESILEFDKAYLENLDDPEAFYSTVNKQFANFASITSCQCQYCNPNSQEKDIEP